MCFLRKSDGIDKAHTKKRNEGNSPSHTHTHTHTHTHQFTTILLKARYSSGQTTNKNNSMQKVETLQQACPGLDMKTDGWDRPSELQVSFDHSNPKKQLRLTCQFLYCQKFLRDKTWKFVVRQIMWDVMRTLYTVIRFIFVHKYFMLEIFV